MEKTLWSSSARYNNATMLETYLTPGLRASGGVNCSGSTSSTTATGSCSLGGLAGAAWETVVEVMVAATGEETLRPGMVAVVQTAGDLGRWHPHVHALVFRGGWTQDRGWAPMAYVDEHAAELLFRHKVMRLLQGEGLLTDSASSSWTTSSTAGSPTWCGRSDRA
jgi:hypothetical protein